MQTFFRITAPLLAAVLTVGSITPSIALAQNVPTYAEPPQPPPEQQQPSYASQDETIHGRIAAVNDPFNISVQDDRGFIDAVSLHQGTIINPTGLSLAAGMSVTIQGTNAGQVFNANEIDTPYAYSGPYPEPVYLGPGYWYPGFAYGYGPSFGIFLGFGFGGGFFERRPFFGHPFFGAVGGRALFGRGVGFDGRGFAIGHGAFNRVGFSRSFAASDRRFTTSARSFSGAGERGGFSRGAGAGSFSRGGGSFSRGAGAGSFSRGGGSFSRGGGAGRGSAGAARGGGGASHGGGGHR
jgi:hypothetical protein